MECVAPSAESWRYNTPDWDDDYVAKELRRAWKGRPHQGPPYNNIHHDWVNFRTATLREARKRGLDLSVVPARAQGV